MIFRRFGGGCESEDGRGIAALVKEGIFAALIDTEHVRALTRLNKMSDRLARLIYGRLVVSPGLRHAHRFDKDENEH